LRYISSQFYDDDEPADVAWAFSFCECDDLKDNLQKYAFGMGRDADDDYARGFQSFVTKITIQRLLLDSQKARDQDPGAHDTSGIEKDVTSVRNGARSRPKTSDVPAKWTAGQARDEELKLRLQQGQSFLDLALPFDRTLGFIVREARRLLGKAGLQKLRTRNKKGKWSEDEIKWLMSLRKEGQTLPKITILLGRTKYSTEKQLSELEMPCLNQS
jgi:hypothetical protein